MKLSDAELRWAADKHKQRMQCYGNAVVPQQFYPIFRAIAEVERMKGTWK